MVLGLALYLNYRFKGKITDLIPANEPFLLPHASKDVQSAGVLVLCVVVARVRRRWFAVSLHGLLDVGGPGLYTDLGHDVRVRYLRRDAFTTQGMSILGWEEDIQ